MNEQAMEQPKSPALVTTIGERCRVCYQCVRECPAKAIRIAEGKAQVLSERCIGCGICVGVCAQKAKSVQSALGRVRELLAGTEPVGAIIAPSFPAEFPDLQYRQVVGMIRALGFGHVHEVAFGADLVAAEYRRLVDENHGRKLIATTCPAVVGYVERYHPRLVPSLAPVVSPMVAMARMLRSRHGQDIRIVFIGPCIAKKREAARADLPGNVDAALTFAELHELLAERQIDPRTVQPSDFDAPRGRGGRLFPISSGMLAAAEIQEDLVTGDVIVAEGAAQFVQAIEEFEAGAMETRLLEVLCCNGCIMGPGMSTGLPQFGRRAKVSMYVRQRNAELDGHGWRERMLSYPDLDLSRQFRNNDMRMAAPSEEQLLRILAQMGKQRREEELNCGACGYPTCRDHAKAIHCGLAETEMCLPFAIEELRRTVSDLGRTNEELANTQEALVRSEKLASMGQLAAGIAHEVNNPLGVVLMYAHFLKDEAAENPQLQDDARMVVEQADRCKKIVAGLLDFARQNKVHIEAVPLQALIERGLRGVPRPEGIEVVTDNPLGERPLEVDPDQLTQVL
ncbi:MAG: histidine kinase, partial [Acidobacteria bacterium]|nr:histidine kinase [Acidobacteriota bacterium]